MGASWTSIITTSLPITLAHHATVEADPTNALVSTNSRFVYVIGGQQNSSDSPGGLTSVYEASVDPTTGVVGNWAQLTNSSLPKSLVGLAAAIFNGQIDVVGGLHSDGTPSADVFSAPVNADGSLGTGRNRPTHIHRPYLSRQPLASAGSSTSSTETQTAPPILTHRAAWERMF